MLNNLKNSSYIPGQLGFNFDIVVVQIDLVNKNIEGNSKLTIDATFNNNNINITSSRINVSQFKPERSYEFNERPSVLKKLLFTNPLECKVYHNSEHIGTSIFLWPESFINCIAEGCGRELTHCYEADIKKDDKKVGRMEIIVRLQIKCQEYEEKQQLVPKFNFCSADDNVLNPNDVMFIVGQTNGSFSCSDVRKIPGSSSGSSEIATCLDLSDFRNLHGKTLSTTNIIDSINAKCCKRKESTDQYKDIIKGVLNKSNDLSSGTNSNHVPQSSCNHQIKSINCTPETKLDSYSCSDSCQPNYCVSDENASGDKSMTSIRENPTRRYCPLCHDDITWLPKFTACPKCAFRPISYHVEKNPYDHSLTADKILEEYANYAPPEHKQSGTTCQQKSRCTCKVGKICAHCRIKKLCVDIFQTSHSAERDCGKCEIKSSDLYNICKTNSRHCRPYLAKVFQDLKKLFEINEAKKKSRITHINKISTSSANVGFRNQQLQEAQQKKTDNHNNKKSQGREKINLQKHEKFTMQNFQKHELCKNKIYDWNKQSKHTVIKVGNRTPPAGQKIVPRQMGWLWNTEENSLRSGWMPGAIRKPITVLMEHFLNKNKINSSADFELNRGCRKQQKIESDFNKEPTLHICKKNGTYYVTLRPLKTIGDLQECLSLHVNMQPIQLKITKNPVLLGLRKLKQDLKSQGFTKCSCHQPISKCCCRSFLERKKLKYQCSKEYHKRDLPNCNSKLILSDTTDSETEFDFVVTPPAGVVRRDSCLIKIKKVSSATQYEEDDWKIKPEYPKPLKKYFRLHNCSIGNRFGKEFGPYGSKGYCPGAVGLDGITGPSDIIPENVSGKFHKLDKVGGIRGAKAFRAFNSKFNMAQHNTNLLKPFTKEMIARKRRK